MAPKKINYGSKKQVYANKNVGSKPIFLLANAETNQIRPRSTSQRSLDFSVKKCFCSDCQSTFDVDLQLQTRSYAHSNSYENDIAFRQHADSKQNVEDIECPDCHNKNAYVCITKNNKVTPKEGHINMSGAWMITPIIEGRYVFAYENEDGTPTRIDDNTIIRDTIIYPSGKIYHSKTEYSETTDLVRNNIFMTQTKIHGEKRENMNIKDSNNPYSYQKTTESFNTTDKYAIKHGDKAADIVNTYDNKNNNYVTIYLQDNPILTIALLPKKTLYVTVNEHENIIVTDNLNPENIKDTCFQISNLKFKIAEKRFANQPDLYKQSANNGLLLKEYHPGSNEENTDVSDFKMSRYYNMIVRYPAAYEYACERVNDRITNHTFSEKRKAEADSSYTPREIAESAKAKMLREELIFVSEQLASVDDKILKTISESKDAADMKQKLQFYVFGDNEQIADTQVPSHIRMKNGIPMQDHLQATKALKASFRTNPIGTANTVYTCHKIGIKDTNHINQMIAITNNSPDVNPASIRKGGKRFTPTVDKEPHVNARTICPVRNTEAIRYLRNYFNTHNHTDAINDTYGSSQNYVETMENIRIYSSIIPYAQIADKPDEIKSNLHEIEKNQIRGYLMNKSVQEAYVDFIEKYKEKTPEIINAFVEEIEHDKHQDDIKMFYDKHGLEETLATYGDSLKDIEDPKTYLDEYVPFQDKQYVLATRNNKPLFQNRTRTELHDELSHMAKNVVRENTPIQYDDEERAFEAEYDAPDGSGKWSFHLHKDTFEMIRTATEMSNCLASHTSRALSKRETLLYMKNEMGEKVACISLNKTYGGGWKVDEFQSPHDNAIDIRYKDICLKWLDEHEINYAGNRNVAAFGTDESFYGGRNIDYHHTEIDETTGTAVSISQMKARQEARIKLAKEIYGVDDNGNIKLPEVPTSYSK